ncbi:MAG TPA: inorganic diphosphatase [Gemmatimonadales bacterium]|nr:inorganic diphosphatase [Gemmatimonadales bacterium]
MSPRQAAGPLAHLSPRKGKVLNVIVETPKGSRNKFKYDEALGIFKINKVLPAGSAFPYDFGFLPGTLAADGDPLDVLLLMDEPAMPGCLVLAHAIGVIEAVQEDGGKEVENDRIIAVADEAHNYSNLHSLKDLDEDLLKDLEEFFVNYHERQGEAFKVKDHRGPGRANDLIKAAARKHQQRKRT